jgi:glycosyltransferase involved in cell wall biosynthesis
MAYGCLPVVSDLPANREWVIDGENGIIVKDQNINEALDRALKIDNQKAIEINSQIIENKATKAANRKKFTAIYDQLINR